MNFSIALNPMHIPVMLLILILYAVVHVAKMTRLYLIVIDEKIPLWRFAFYYFLTTLVNLIVPFKLGEFFRLFIFSKVTKSVRIGVLSVLLDRFFDTVALVLILLPYELLSGGVVTNSTLLLTVFVAVAVFVYIFCYPSYRYLNRYLITNRSSRRAMTGLRVIERIRTEYDYVKRLLDGRYALLVILSFGAWLLECAFLYIFAWIKGESGMDFSAYIGAIISSGQSSLMRSYLIWYGGMTAIAVIFCMIMMLSAKNKAHTR